MDDINLRSAEEHKQPKDIKLPRGVKMIQLDENRVIFMRYTMGRWTQIPRHEEERLLRYVTDNT